jgi:hypothetical protein
MTVFSLYFSLGVEHILDLNGFDHLLFLIALCAIYPPREWKTVLVLITAFTLGHSFTLAMASLGWMFFSIAWVEFLIPVTIFVTGVSNLIQPAGCSGSMLKIKYLLALFFGMIHGLGFSNYLKSLLGSQESIFTPLLSFNLGVELGQILIVLGIGLMYWISQQLFAFRQRDWSLVVSGMAMGISFLLLTERLP